DGHFRRALRLCLRGGIARGALLGGLLRVALVAALGGPQRHTVLRAPRTGQARFHGAEIELEHVRVLRGLLALIAPETLVLRVRGDEVDPLPRAAGELEVAEGLLVDREDAASA